MEKGKMKKQYKKEIPFLPVLDDITSTIKIKNNLNHNSIEELSIVDAKILKNIISQWIKYFESHIDKDGQAGSITLIDGGIEKGFENSFQLDYYLSGGYELDGICKFLRFFVNNLHHCPHCNQIVDRWRDGYRCPNCFMELK